MRVRPFSALLPLAAMSLAIGLGACADAIPPGTTPGASPPAPDSRDALQNKAHVLAERLNRTQEALAVSARVPLVDVPPISLLVMILAVPVVLVAANAVAIWPARKAARRNPTEALRSE